VRRAAPAGALLVKPQREDDITLRCPSGLVEKCLEGREEARQAVLVCIFPAQRVSFLATESRDLEEYAPSEAPRPQSHCPSKCALKGGYFHVEASAMGTTSWCAVSIKGFRLASVPLRV